MSEINLKTASFDEYYKHYKVFYKSYRNSGGKKALSICLKEDEEEIKYIILKSRNEKDFETNLRNHWETTFCHTIDNNSGIEKVYLLEGYDKLIPVSKGYKTHQKYRFLVSESFFKHLLSHFPPEIKEECTIYVRVDEFLYPIRVYSSGAIKINSDRISIECLIQ